MNDWSLRKGDPPLIQSARLGESTTFHRVVEETKDSIVVECDLSREDLVPIVKGHNVNGIPLCTPVSFLLFIPRDTVLLLMLIFTSRYMRILP